MRTSAPGLVGVWVATIAIGGNHGSEEEMRNGRETWSSCLLLDGGNYLAQAK